MRNHLHIRGRVINALVLAAVFAFIGQSVPHTYYKYFDKREYVKVELPVDTDLKVYNACDQVILSTRIDSEISASLRGIFQLTMFNNDGNLTPVRTFEFKDFVVERASNPYEVTVAIPCGVPEGVYYYEGVFKYDMKGIPHEVYFYSGKVNVVSYPLSPKPGKDDL